MNIKEMERRLKCHGVIHAASLSAGAVGAGLAQVPGSDTVVITPIQTVMAMALGRIYGRELTESASQAACVTVASTSVGGPW